MIGSLISFLVIGLIAGWIAGKVLSGEGFGLVSNLIIGCIGSIVGGVLFWVIGLSPHNVIGSLITAVIGAFVFLFVAGKLKAR
jgi:uncharacterized membrane protein YeaQ/YmgE (transglycosylase-associated protein family)